MAADRSRGGVAIYFLLPQGKSEETCSEKLSDAFSQSEENGLTPMWIASDKALAKKPTKTVRNFEIFCIRPITDRLLSYYCPITDRLMSD